MHSVITQQQLDRALALRDLSDPAAGPHAMQLVADAIGDALERAWGAPVLVHRASPVVTIHENYEVLGYPAGAPAREARYTRYVDDAPAAAHAHDRDGARGAAPPRSARLNADDVVVACPGLVYRRDVVDRLHVGEPHQLDLWRVRRGRAAHHRRPGRDDRPRRLGGRCPARAHRTLPATHPYTTEGREVEVEVGGGWVELLECGLAGRARPARRAGSTPRSGRGSRWASASTARSCCERVSRDIRLLRSDDPRVARPDARPRALPRR